MGNLPMAVCVIAGTRFSGLPKGSSPINADGCAPTGLKYLSKMALIALLFTASLTICSPICLVAP